MNKIEALNYAIFAINTCLEPQASSQEDMDRLDAHGEEAIKVLAALRASLDPRTFERETKEAIAVANSHPRDDVCPGIEAGGECTCTDDEVFGP